MSSDPELLRRYVQESSQEAFAELVQRHIDFVYATALRQAGSEARAKDVTQAVFTDLARKAAQLATRNDIVGWLHTSTHYAANGLRRSEARRVAREQKAQLMHQPDHSSAATDSIDWDKLRPVLDDALRELGERDREAILLRYFKQHSFGEIGDALGLSEEAARKRIDRGVDKLRGLLAKRGVTSTLVALEIAMASQAAVAAPAGLAATVTTSALAIASAHATTLLAQLLAVLKTVTLATAVVAAFISGGLAVNSASTARDAEKTRASAKQQLASLHREQEQLTKRLAEIEQIRSARQRTFAELKAATAARIQRIWPKDSGEKIVDALLQLSLDAEMEAMLKSIEPILFSAQYFHGPIFAELKLTPQQIEQFLKISRGNAPLSPSYKFFDEGDGRGRFNLALGWSNAQEDENSLKLLLGEAGFEKYQNHSKTMFIQMLIVNKLASNLLYTTAPLDAATATRLTGILASANSDPDSPSPTDIDWEKALKEAQPILTPIQLKALARLSGNLSTQWSYDL